MKPLHGVRVLDFTKVLAGPLCAQYLGDLGADVIKLESREHGDDTRRWPPFRGKDGTVFLSANRNKRSIAVDLKAPAGRKIARQLARQADVVIESFGPGISQKLGVDYESLSADHPRLIYCSISGFGPNGPLRSGKGYDVILQAFSGMMSITGDPDGPPMRSPFSPVDQTTGIHAMSGILAALLNRERSGQGARIETSLFDTSVAFLAYFLQGYWEKGTEPQKVGSGHESLCPYQAFQASDKPILLGVANDNLWRKFCEIAGLADIMDDPRFATNADRVKHRAQTVGMVQAVMVTRTRDEWIALLGQAGIPGAPINSLADMLNHPHTAASGIIFDYEHRAYGKLKAVGQPILFNGERNEPTLAPPMHGEHTVAILRELGYSDEEIRQIGSDKITFSGSGEV